MSTPIHDSLTEKQKRKVLTKLIDEIKHVLNKKEKKTREQLEALIEIMSKGVKEK